MPEEVIVPLVKLVVTNRCVPDDGSLNEEPVFVKFCPSPENDVAVHTPAILTLSKFVCPSTSKSPVILAVVPLNVVAVHIPETIAPVAVVSILSLIHI